MIYLLRTIIIYFKNIYLQKSPLWPKLKDNRTREIAQELRTLIFLFGARLQTLSELRETAK